MRRPLLEKLHDELEALRMDLFATKREHPEHYQKISELEKRDRSVCKQIITLEDCEHPDFDESMDGARKCLVCGLEVPGLAD